MAIPLGVRPRLRLPLRLRGRVHDEQQTDGADYNYVHVEAPGPQREGLSAFALQNDAVHHTYSTYARGVEALMGTYQYLDLAPAGRNEADLPFRQAWWRRHDEHESGR